MVNLALVNTHEFFNFPHKIKFANLEFMIAIKGPKLARTDI